MENDSTHTTCTNTQVSDRYRNFFSQAGPSGHNMYSKRRAILNKDQRLRSHACMARPLGAEFNVEESRWPDVKSARCRSPSAREPNAPDQIVPSLASAMSRRKLTTSQPCRNKSPVRPGGLTTSGGSGSSLFPRQG